MDSNWESAPLVSAINSDQNTRYAPNDVASKGLERTGVLFGGVLRDIKRRTLYFFYSDWTDGLSWKTVSAALFMFFATFASTVALGELARRQTDGHIGVTEYLLLQGGCGLIHASLAGQPLLILRPTGPITVFITELYTLSKTFGFDYFEWLAWVGLWVGIYMTVIASFDGSYYITYFSRFLHDLYAAFVCTIYTVDGIQGIYHRFATPDKDIGHSANYASSLFAMLLAGIVVSVGLALHSIEHRKVLSRQARRFISDYALSIAVFIAIAISYCTTLIEVDRIPLPKHFSPTYEDADGPRSWATDTSHSSAGLIGGAALAAIPIVALFYIDQSISALLTQVPSVQLAKGDYFHFSFLLTGLFNAAFPMFGLPFVTASLPHSPQFARALSETAPDGKVVRVRENRIAPLIVDALCLAAIWARMVLVCIPEGVVDGILTFVGVAGLLSKNEFIERVGLLFTQRSDFPDNVEYTSVTTYKMHLYTLIQLGCLACCWIIKQTPAGLAFPLFIVMLVPFRSYVLPKLFTSEELAVLDREDLADQAEEPDYERLA